MLFHVRIIALSWKLEIQLLLGVAQLRLTQGGSEKVTLLVLFLGCILQWITLI